MSKLVTDLLMSMRHVNNGKNSSLSFCCCTSGARSVKLPVKEQDSEKSYGQNSALVISSIIST